MCGWDHQGPCGEDEIPSNFARRKILGSLVALKLVDAYLTTSLQVLGHVGIALLTIGLGVIVLHVVEPFLCSHAANLLVTSGSLVLVQQTLLSTCRALILLAYTRLYLWTPL